LLKKKKKKRISNICSSRNDYDFRQMFLNSPTTCDAWKQRCICEKEINRKMDNEGCKNIYFSDWLFSLKIFKRSAC